jgi:hypothetical protein
MSAVITVNRVIEGKLHEPLKGDTTTLGLNGFS